MLGCKTFFSSNVAPGQVAKLIYSFVINAFIVFYLFYRPYIFNQPSVVSGTVCCFCVCCLVFVSLLFGLTDWFSGTTLPSEYPAFALSAKAQILKMLFG